MNGLYFILAGLVPLLPLGNSKGSAGKWDPVWYYCSWKIVKSKKDGQNLAIIYTDQNPVWVNAKHIKDSSTQGGYAPGIGRPSSVHEGRLYIPEWLRDDIETKKWKN